MAERVKVSLSTFLACFIAIATAFVLVEGSGWQKKRARVRGGVMGRERETLACSSLLARFYQSSSLPTQDPGALNSQGHWRGKMNNSSTCFCILHIREGQRKVLAHTDRGRHHCTHGMRTIVLHKTHYQPAEGSWWLWNTLEGSLVKKQKQKKAGGI